MRSLGHHAPEPRARALPPPTRIHPLLPLIAPPSSLCSDGASAPARPQALLHLGKKGSAEFRAAVASLDAADRTKLQSALGGGRAATPQGSAGPASGAAASAAAEEVKPKIALKMDFSAFGGQAAASKPAAVAPAGETS